MNILDLFTNAGINIGLAILFLTLYSVFSKQPGNAGVYFARDLLKESRKISVNKERRTVESFIPSVGWVIRAWRTTEEEILEAAGLDAVVFLRIFILSIRLFAICSAIGLFVLVPTTFTVTHADDEESWARQDFDKFSINNLDTGSKRLWIHFGAVYVISLLVYCMLYMEYRNIATKRLNYLFQVRPQPDQFSVLLRAIPKDSDGMLYSDRVQEFFSRYHPDTYLSHQMVYNASKVEGMMCRFCGKDHECLYLSVIFFCVLCCGIPIMLGNDQLKLESMKVAIDRLKRMPAKRRQARREGFCGLYGQKVDPVEREVRKLEHLYQKIRETQRQILHKDKEIPSAIVSFKSRWGAAVAAQSLQAENPLNWVTEWAPEPRDVYWSNLSMSTSQAFFRHIMAGVVVCLITVFYCVPSAAIAGINNTSDVIEILHKFGIDFLSGLFTLPGVQAFVSGYLSTLLLAALLYAIPSIMLFISTLEGFSSKSTQEYKACEKFFYFLAGPIFFIQVLGGGVIQLYTEWEYIKDTSPASIPYRLAARIPGQATFFMSYVMTTGWAGFPLEILNIATLVLNVLKRHTGNRDSAQPEPELHSLQYYRIIPNVLLFIFVGIIYSVIAPLLPPFLLVYFALGFIVFKNQVVHVYDPAYETAGQFWPLVHNRIIAALIVMQITFLGIFEAKMSTKVAFAIAPLPFATIIFYLYCNNRFYPVFLYFSVESTKKKDNEDDRRGLQDEILRIIPDAYRHPGLKPVNISGYGNPEAGHLLPSDSLP